MKQPAFQNTACLIGLLDTVQRIIDGAELDDEDKAVTSYVAECLLSHAEFLDSFTELVNGNKNVSISFQHDSTDLVDCLWESAATLNDNSLPKNDTKMLRRFALNISLVGMGYKAPAQQVEAIVERAYHQSNQRSLSIY